MKDQISVGDFCLYDPENTTKKLDTDVRVVKVVGKKAFGRVFYVVPVDSNFSRNIAPVEVRERMLKKMSENPEENVIIRYPANIPIFSQTDTKILADIAMYALKNASDLSLTDEDMLKISSLVQKVKFYAEIAENYRPNIEG